VKAGFERVVVRAPNWLGDAVLSLAAVRDVRRNFPGARIEVLARPALGELYGAVAEVDASRTRLDGGAFELAVLLPNSIGSALQVYRAGIPERWGYATDGRGLLLTRAARVPRVLRGRSQVYYYRAMLAGVGLEVSASPDASLQCPEAWSARGRELLGGEGPWLGLNPGAAYGGAKRWLPSRYAAVADVLARRRGARVAILGGAVERGLAQAIAGAMQGPARVLAGETSLADLVGVVSRLELLVTNDSGPMHLAAALGVPLVAVFGPTDWTETAPVGERWRLVREPVECSPCLLRECPIDHRCMRRVGVERVADEALALLGGLAAGPAA
jgi:heptosyltransferase-2